MFYLETRDKSDCSGCRACEQICPNGCIEMIEDEEGFYYPEMDRKSCINCNLCKDSCPNENSDILLKHNAKFDCNSKAYMVINKDKDILDRSSSGGAFSAIVNAFCNENFVVFGVELDEDLNAIHSYTEKIQGTCKYRKSKYVQSNIKDSYKKVLEFLKTGKKVLFTGTPCQIAALKLYLKNEYTNLLCVDIICHGVPSQKVFNSYLSYLEKKYRGSTDNFTFRVKTLKSKSNWNSKNVSVVINDRTRNISSGKDLYLRGFHRSLFCRNSCYKCKYACNDRVSDITIGDFWGVEKLYPSENPHRGVSALLTNNIKGQQIMEDISKYAKVVEIDRNFVIDNNEQLRKPTKMHAKRKKFFKILNQTGRYNKAVVSCIPATRIIAAKVLNERSKVFLKKFIR